MPGHRKARRTLVPPEQVHQTFDCKPTACRRCGRGPRARTPSPGSIKSPSCPASRPVVDEYRLHRLTCSGCGDLRPLPEGVPTGRGRPVPPGRAGDVRGAYRLSKRQIQQLAADLFALRSPPG
ncbi:MAG: hypothetical protein U0790_17270 [Isosphaeraceae bacterium]